MTFYNVISGILFLAACQAFVRNLGTPMIWLAALLVVTILNESLLTSELIERKTNEVEYTLPMKLVDFANFVIFSWALLVLSPTENAFSTDVTATLWGAGKLSVFWILLTAYWLLVLLWNHLGGQLDPSKWKPWFYTAMRLMWLPPLAAFGISLATDSGLPAIACLCLTACYLLSKIAAPAKRA